MGYSFTSSRRFLAFCAHNWRFPLEGLDLCVMFPYTMIVVVNHDPHRYISVFVFD